MKKKKESHPVVNQVLTPEFLKQFKDSRKVFPGAAYKYPTTSLAIVDAGFYMICAKLVKFRSFGSRASSGSAGWKSAGQVRDGLHAV